MAAWSKCSGRDGLYNKYGTRYMHEAGEPMGRNVVPITASMMRGAAGCRRASRPGSGSERASANGVA